MTWGMRKPGVPPQNFFYKRKDSLLRAFPPLLKPKDRHTHTPLHLNDKKLFTRTGSKMTYVQGTALSLNPLLHTKIVK